MKTSGPATEKQGYVIRRLLRRAVLDAYQMGQREPLLHQLVPGRRRGHEGGYPDLSESMPRIQTSISKRKSSSSATSKTA